MDLQSDGKEREAMDGIVEAMDAWDALDLLEGLEGSDCWDDPSVWERLEQLGEPDVSDLCGDSLWFAESGESLLEDADILGAPEPPEHICPLARCAWAKEGICVFLLGDWCPNRPARESARRNKKNMDLGG